jgi:hypothetical protein
LKIRLSLLLAALLLATAAGAADARAASSEFAGHRTQLDAVVVVRGLKLADLKLLARHGAVGLLVPSAGPRTSASLALAGIVRGVLHNGRLGARPDAPVLIRVEKSENVPITKRTIVIGLPPNRTVRNDRRYPIAVFGACHGILDSSLTRVPGVVSAADVARTALGTVHALGCRPVGTPARALHALEHRIETARGSTMIATVLVMGILMAFALVFPAAVLPALAAALAVNLGLGFVPAGGVETRLTLFAVCIVAGGFLGRRVAKIPLVAGLGLAGLLAAYAVTMAVQPAALSFSPLGPELTSRFYGVSNLLETLLLVPALLAAAHLGRRHGLPALLLVALLALATIAENRLGDDGGGAVVLGVSFAVLAVLMTRARLRMLAPALAIAAAAVLALLAIDSATSSPDHLQGALGGGPHELLTVLAHRVPLAYARVAQQWYLVIPLTALALLIVRSRQWRTGRDRRALVLAYSAGIVTSLLLNDSPGPVTLAALGSFFALESDALRRELELLAARLLPPAPVPVAPAAAPARVPAKRT